MRKGGCVPLSLRVCVDEIFGKNTWDALSRRYEDLCGNQPVGRVHHRWRGGGRDDSARTCRKIVISTQVMEWSLNGGKVTMMTMFDGTSRAPGVFGGMN